MIRTLAAAWRFLTIIPLPVFEQGDESKYLSQSMPCFPLVGAILGGAAFLVAWLAGQLFPPPVTAVLCVITLASFSGGLHLDGLADSGDGLLSPGRSAEKALAVMKDSRVGAHGAMALAGVLLCKTFCLASLDPLFLPFAVAAVPVAGRAGMILPMTLLPYGRAEGLGKIFAVRSPVAMHLWAISCVGFTVFGMWDVWRACVGIVFWLLVNLGWSWYLRRRLGGATGDTYGAACELSETVLCLAAAVMPYSAMW